MECLRLFVVVIFALATLGIKAQWVSHIQAYIEQYKEIALEQERQFGIPASITLAQAILESEAGRSRLAREANNHFGIKSYGGWSGAVFYAWDDEAFKSSFRSYQSVGDSYRDHSRFLSDNGRYNSLFRKSVYDYRGWANGLQIAGYATSRTYAKALIGYIELYKLYRLNGGMKLKPGKTVVITHHKVRETIDKEEEYVEQNDSFYDDVDSGVEDEKSEEEENVTNILQKVVVEVNEVRCTILYPGETLSSISLKYDIPKQKLLEFNETGNEFDIKEGDIVFLERKKKVYNGALDFYRVRDGDTLYGISQQFGIRLSNLIKMNNRSLFSKLSVGEKIDLK